jgi:H+/gluconate symporter-like permease
MAEQQREWLDLAPALALALAGFLAVSWMTLAGSDQSGQQLVVIFPPGTGTDQAASAIAQADGLLVRAGGWSGVIVAEAAAPGFASRVRALGAWAVFRVPRPGGCMTATAPGYS